MDEQILKSGQVVEDIPIELHEKAAKIFSEGNKSLENLLLYCFKNNIKTVACCAGHEEKNKPFGYLSFKNNEKDIGVILKLIYKLKNIDNIEWYMGKDRFTVYSIRTR